MTIPGAAEVAKSFPLDGSGRATTGLGAENPTRSGWIWSPRHSAAVPYLDLAQRAARDEHNHDLLAVVLACRAFLASFRGDSPRLAADLADGAVSAAREGATSRTLAWVSAVSSEHHASSGDVHGSQRRLDVARRALTQAGNNALWSGLEVFDERKIRAYEGGNLTRLGLHGEAIAVLDDALDSFGPDMPWHRCAALTDRAGAYHSAGDVDATCADASEALAIAVRVGHQHTVRRITRLARKMLKSQAACARRLWIDVLAARSPNKAAESVSCGLRQVPRRLAGLILDFGGVLTTSFDGALRSFCVREGLEPDALERVFSLDTGARGTLVELERGAISQAEFVAQLAPALGVDPERLLPRMAADLRLEPVVVDAVAELRRQGIRTAVISNSWGSSASVQTRIYSKRLGTVPRGVLHHYGRSSFGFI